MNDEGNICLVSVDGTDFRILNWKPFWTGWYSHKFHGPGVRYEVAVCILTGHIVWINGPFPCGRYADITIFRRDLIHELEDNEKVEADKGYRGEPNFIVTPQEDNLVQSAVRGRHETVNKRFKQFGCLYQTFRHGLQKHFFCFNAVVALTQLAIENGEPLYQVMYTSVDNP